ncbi:MAG: hypothetical protein C5B53_04315 [Candidatus Melainabacteria bacterium]|nr:MAG: hypothetical protein C5B53_04315 [Candidatus Melainabacteria bacterium]
MQLQQEDRRLSILPPKPYAALIFDCDGTLADTMPLHYQVWTEVLGSRGVTFTEEQFYSFAGRLTIEIVRMLNDRHGYNLDPREIEQEKEDRYAQIAHQALEIQAVTDIARDHFGKVPMAVASGGHRSVVETTLRSVGIRELFDIVVGAGDVKQGKPAPDLFLLAAERMGVASDSCVVYEDADLGVEAARRAGMRVVDVRVLWQNRHE